MKLAYRIITPILAIAAMVMGVMLKLFYFAIGSEEETIDTIVSLLEYFGVQTVYEFSAVELAQMLVTGANTTSDAGSLLEIISPIVPEIIAFFIFLTLTILTFVIIAGLAAMDKKKKNVILTCIAGIVLTFVCIIISNSAFSAITSGEISINDLIALYTDSTWIQLAAVIVSITEATLSAGFYALFGMFILIIFWTVLADALIKNPIEKKKKSYKRNSFSKKMKMKVSK